jgi:hypothetical protein
LKKKFKECEKGDDITPFDGTGRQVVKCTEAKANNSKRYKQLNFIAL